MSAKVVPFDHSEAVEQALESLRQGGVIAFPTDTVYGVAVSAFDRDGIERLFQIKGRSFDKAIAVLLGEEGQVEQLAQVVPVSAHKLAHAFWPGALTLVVPKKQGLPENLSQFPTVGLRMPDHKLLRLLLRKSGPLATTSANPSGYNSSTSADEVLQTLGEKLDLILDGGRTPGAVASTVVNCATEEVTILREGVIDPLKIFAVLEQPD